MTVANYEAIREVIPKTLRSFVIQLKPLVLLEIIKCGLLWRYRGFSFNYHTCYTGEGLIVTNNDYLAERCRLIRNHAEAVLDSRPTATLNNMIGFNLEWVR